MATLRVGKTRYQWKAAKATLCNKIARCKKYLEHSDFTLTQIDSLSCLTPKPCQDQVQNPFQLTPRGPDGPSKLGTLPSFNLIAQLSPGDPTPQTEKKQPKQHCHEFARDQKFLQQANEELKKKCCALQKRASANQSAYGDLILLEKSVRLQLNDFSEFLNGKDREIDQYKMRTKEFSELEIMAKAENEKNFSLLRNNEVLMEGLRQNLIDKNSENKKIQIEKNSRIEQQSIELESAWINLRAAREKLEDSTLGFEKKVRDLGQRCLKLESKFCKKKSDCRASLEEQLSLKRNLESKIFEIDYWKSKFQDSELNLSFYMSEFDRQDLLCKNQLAVVRQEFDSQALAFALTREDLRSQIYVQNNAELGLRSEFEKKISELGMTLEFEVRAKFGAKDGTIGKLESQVMEQHRQVDSLQEIVDSKAQWAKELQSAFEQKDSKMADLDNFTRSQTAQLESLKKDLENQSEQFRKGQLLVSAESGEKSSRIETLTIENLALASKCKELADKHEAQLTLHGINLLELERGFQRISEKNSPRPKKDKKRKLDTGIGVMRSIPLEKLSNFGSGNFLTQ